jgi:primary-amine oxidase
MRFIVRWCALFGVLFITGLLPVAVAAQEGAVSHPLDSLTPDEITKTVEILRAADRLTPEMRFGALSLQEPSKAQVSEDAASGQIRRAATALLYDWASGMVSEAVIDLNAGKVVSWRDFAANNPPVMHLMVARFHEAARRDPRVLAALRRRGITDMSRITMLPGQGIPPRQGNDRVANSYPFNRDAPPPGDIIAGLTVTVNLTRGTVIAVNDTGVSTPAPNAPGGTNGGSPSSPPATVPGLQRNGSELRWNNWRLRFGMHPRRGLEIYDVAYQDGGNRRSILYRASMAEAMAIYGDPGFGSWAPIDEGDFGMFSYSRASLVPGGDAPPGAVFVNASFPDDTGKPVEVPRAVAIYERDAGVLWRHGNTAKRARQLVLTACATIDNYDYLLLWIFGQDGSIDVQVQLTGVMNYRKVTQRSDAGARHDDSFAHLVAPGISAPNHQHFFSFRLDFDLDGSDGNRVVEMDTDAVPEGPSNRTGEWFAMRERVLETEQEGRRTLDLSRSRRWKIVTERVANRIGQPSSYVLLPGENAVPYSTPNSPPRRKAGFVGYHLWVTSYQPNEMHPAGEYPNLNVQDAGLPTWTNANRPIRDTDLVLWYTLGITHLPRTEDWPIMPVHTAGFRLVPAGFFGRNPTLTTP